MTINLSLPTKLLKLIDRQAKSELRSRSEFFREAARVYLVRAQNWKSLQRYGAAHAKKMGLREEDVDRLVQEFRKEQHDSKNGR